MKTTRITLLIIAAALLGSCKKGGAFCHREKGEVVIESRDHQNFDRIALATQGDVYITQGDVYAVKIEATQNIIDVIRTEVNGNTLVIDTRKGKCITGDPTIKFHITAPNIAALDISGSGNIYADHLIETDNIDMKISGSGGIHLDSLQGNHMGMTISGSGSMNVQSVGTVHSQDIVIAGSGSIHALDAPVNNSVVTISGSGSANLHVLQSLKVNISGSGDVVYKGSPLVTTNISGSGDVRPY